MDDNCWKQNGIHTTRCTAEQTCISVATRKINMFLEQTHVWTSRKSQSSLMPTAAGDRYQERLILSTPFLSRILLRIRTRESGVLTQPLLYWRKWKIFFWFQWSQENTLVCLCFMIFYISACRNYFIIKYYKVLHNVKAKYHTFTGKQQELKEVNRF